MSTSQKFIKELSIDFEFTIPPNNHAPVKLKLEAKQDQLILDVVRTFMSQNDIPCYLEVSILSIIESLMIESWRIDMEIDSKIDKETEAKQIREQFVTKYKKYTVRYNDTPVEDHFPIKYHTLVHSQISPIFNMLLQLEDYYKQTVKELNDSYEKEHENILQIETAQGIRESRLEELKKFQKEEYHEFVLQLYETHQKSISEHTNQTNTNGSFADLTSLHKLDGREIISKAIDKIKKNNDMLNTKISNELLKLDKECNFNTLHGSRQNSIGSMSDLFCSSPTLMSPPSPKFSAISGFNTEEKKPMIYHNDDPELINLINHIQEFQMSYTNEQAKIALEIANGNMDNAVVILMDDIARVNEVISSGGSVNSGGSISNGLPTTPRRPSLPIFNSSLSNLSSSSSQKDLPPQPKRSKTINRPLSILTKQDTKKNWSQFFFQQKQNSMLSSPTNSTGRKIGLWINKAMENFRLEEANGHGHNMQLDNSHLVESFTITIGNQVKSTNNLRLLVSDIEDVISSSNDSAKEMAYRAQTAANLYSQNLNALILLLTPKDWAKYKIGKSANKEFFKKCKESTEFHFNDVETQLDIIQKVYPIDTEEPSLKEAIQKSELTPRSPAISGLRNILRTVDRFDINSINIPFFLLPSNTHVFSDSTLIQEHENLLYKRCESVLKCTKGFMINNSRIPKQLKENSSNNYLQQDESKTLTFLLPKTFTESEFNTFRYLLTNMFRAT
ncbi:13342_t:CDS:2 [Entrophospora sp. SA101]|nr:4207_t:CDS:2 [Entrophospora sp. SA101]CAJ0831265.1 13342_t:CDS:2 [Entrophospora sp. SA101]